LCNFSVLLITWDSEEQIIIEVKSYTEMSWRRFYGFEICRSVNSTKRSTATRSKGQLAGLHSWHIAKFNGYTTLCRDHFGEARFVVVLFCVAHFVAGSFWSGPFWREFHENNFFFCFCFNFFNL